jgi:hypothetical protein
VSRYRVTAEVHGDLVFYVDAESHSEAKHAVEQELTVNDAAEEGFDLDLDVYRVLAVKETP